MSSAYDFLEMQGAEDMVMAFLGVFLVVMLISSIYSLVVYILHSVGVYSIAKRRGIHHPWLAWIPIAKVWTLGSISDQYQYLAKKKVTNRRKVLLGLTIATEVIAWGVIVIAVKVIVDAVALIGAGSAITTQILSSVMLMYVVYWVMLIVAIVMTVFIHIADYDLFVSSRPANAVLFLVLSIIFSFLMPYFVFACRKRDDGMPAREAPVQPEAPQYIPAPQPADSDVPVAEEQDFAPEEE